MTGHLSKIISFFVCIALSFSAIQAQSKGGGKPRDLYGTVLDVKTGEPVMFVTVIVKGTNTNTYSDTNGRFSIKAANGDVLLFSLLGYDPVEYPVTSQTKNISIQLKESTQMLDDAVVTALGITREEKSIGYAVSKVKSDELNTSVSNNWVNNLDGKVAGLSMEQASTGPGGAVRVTLRGENSLSHDNNEALFVIDGVPMISGMVESSSGSGYGSSDAPIDYGNGIGDINPEDIESVTVLKGPAATALYGSHAANGAVVITTKTGKDTEKKIKVELNTSVQLENAGYWPDFQNEYGMGNGNASHRLAQQYSSFWTVPAEMSDTGEKISSTYSRAAFGPAYAGQMYYNYNGANWYVLPCLFTGFPWLAPYFLCFIKIKKVTPW